jgi:hypothetical protein
LFPARDELPQSAGNGGLLGGLTAQAEGVVKQVLIESEIRSHV